MKSDRSQQEHGAPGLEAPELERRIGDGVIEQLTS